MVNDFLDEIIAAIIDVDNDTASDPPNQEFVEKSQPSQPNSAPNVTLNDSISSLDDPTPSDTLGNPVPSRDLN